jgi:hypothetical protein
MATTFLFGILLEILSGFVGTGGKQLIGLSARLDNPCRSKVTLWLGQFMNSLLGAVLDVAAYAFAPQSVIGPLNGVPILVNILSAPWTLDEHVTKEQVVATAFVALGASLTAVFGPHSSDPLSLEEMKEKLFTWVALCYASVFSIVLLLCIAIIYSRPIDSSDRARGIALGISAGGLAGNVCFMKCVVEIVRENACGNWSPWDDWLPYVLVVLAVMTAVGNTIPMTMGLQEYENEVVFMIALMSGSTIVTACVSGQLVLREMADQSLQQQAAYWASVFIIVLGLMAIRRTTVHDQQEHSEAIDRFAQDNCSRLVDDEFSNPRKVQRQSSKDIIRKKTKICVLSASPITGIVSVTTFGGTRKLKRAVTLPASLQELERGNGAPRKNSATPASFPASVPLGPARAVRVRPESE